MYEAHLSDPIHGESTKIAETPAKAVELAFRDLASYWMRPEDHAGWPANTPMFDGEIRNDIEVWWYNRAWSLIGVVKKL